MSLPVVAFLVSFASLSAALVCDPLAYGAVGNGKVYDTVAIRKAANACGLAGGGTVIFSAGYTFLTGAFNVSNNTLLQVDGTILGSPNSTDYTLVEPLPWFGPDPSANPSDPREWQPLISTWYNDNVSIAGTGTIDGQGTAWWGCASNSSLPPCNGYPRPHMIRFVGGTGFEISGVSIMNSPMWQVHLSWVSSVYVHDVNITAPASPASHNTDGIDPDCAQDVLIERVHISTGDDNIAVKSGKDWFGRTFGRPSRNITVRNSVFGTGHGITIGSEMSGSVFDVLFENITATGITTGPRVKSQRGRGGVVANVTFRNITLSNVTGEAVQLTMNYSPDIPPTNATGTPQFINITLDGVASASSKQGWFLDGLPESPIVGLTLRDVDIAGVSKQQIVGCDNVDKATSTCDATSVRPACPPCVPQVPA